MEFTWPQMLWGLILVPALVVAYVLLQRRRQRYVIRYASLSLVKDALGRGPGWRRHLPPALFLLSLTVMLIALARPVRYVTLPAQEGTVILAMDVSGSMRAGDVSPTRLEAAKAAAHTFIDNQPAGVKIGVVGFSDNAFLLQAPTDQKDAVRAAIDRLQPQRGTAIGSGLLTSLDAIFQNSDNEGDQSGQGLSQPTPPPPPLPKGVYEPAIIVLLSDGQSNRGPRPLDIIDRAATRGIRVYTIGLGSRQGAVLQNFGRSMRVQLDETTLKAIAQATDGKYYNASTTSDLQSIYQNLNTQLVFRRQQTEITALFTAAALLIALAAASLSLLWFSRIM